jgi:hypothetical protein
MVKTGEWRASGKSLQIGNVQPIPQQFRDVRYRTDMEKMRWPTATLPTSWELNERATVKFLRTQNPLKQERMNETSCLDTDGDFNRWPATSQSLHRESRWYATRLVRAVREGSFLPPGRRMAGRARHHGGDEQDRPPRATRAMEG